MKIHFCSFVFAATYIWTCSGHLIGEPPHRLRPEEAPYQKDPFAHGDVHVPPLAYLEEYSVIDKEIQLPADEKGAWKNSPKMKDNDRSPLPDAEPGRNSNIPLKDTFRTPFPNVETEEVGSSLNDEKSDSSKEDYSKRLPVDEDLEERTLRAYWMDFYSKSYIDDSIESKRKKGQQLSNSLGKFYLPPRYSEEVDPQCRNDVKLIYTPPYDDYTLGNITLMIDSWGKIPDGFLAGNIRVTGSFDECLATVIYRPTSETEGPKGSFKGKYCYVMFKNSPPHENSTVGGTPNIAPKMLSPLLAEVGLLPYIGYGTCMPSSCNVEDLTVSLNMFLGPMDESVGIISCQTEDSPVVEFDAALIIMTVVLSIFALLLLSGAAVDIWILCTGKEELRKGPLKYLLVFSFYTNLEKMFHISTAVNKEAITCLYGMRVLSMTWVVWGHQYLMTLSMSGNEFLVPADMTQGHWFVQIISNAMPSVDTFFFMSGLLVAYGVLKEKERKGRINLIVFYIHRYIRLAIPIMMVGGVMAAFPKYMVHGPFAGMVDGPNSLQDNCKKYWWRDAVFASNFVPSTSVPPICLGVCWYTAVDFQIFIVTPIVLFPFLWGEMVKLNQQQRTKIGFIWLGILTLASALIPGIITVANKLPPASSIATTDHDLMMKQNELVYSKPWCRASPYLVGMALGILLRLDKKKNLTLKTWQVIIGWIIAVAAGLKVVFNMYRYNQIGLDPGYYWPDSFFYAAFHTLAWGLALAWVVYACQYGYGGPVNTFLSHPSWQPLSRLTFCLFLLAIPVQEIVFIYNYEFALYFSHLTKVLETPGVLFISGIGAVLLSLIVEAPVLGLEKFLLGRGK